MKKQDKKQIVTSLAEKLEKASSVVLVNYTKMNVGLQQELKSALKEVGASMTVTKNTLIKLAGKKAKSPKEVISDEVLVGQTALVVTEDDPIAPLQVLAKFTKEFEVPSMKVGVVEGVFQDEAMLITLSRLPGKDVLAGQVVGALMAPSYGLVSVLNANMQKLIYVLQQKVKSEG